MNRGVVLLFCGWIIVSIPLSVWGDVNDPFDPFASPVQPLDDDALDDQKTVEQLIAEAEFLLDDEKLLEARSKLLKALKKDPLAYRAHMLLSGYYMVHVGHFRLSYKYAEQAKRIFLQSEGPPPYSDLMKRLVHAQLLYLLSQAHLNLDDYNGSLRVLDEFSSFGYTAGWYPGSRAWVLMKLGRLEDAIRVARLGVVAGAEPGRTLNMLGILLSMHDDREESIQVFREAIAFELSRGQLGQPATPMNNVGEVFKEIFEEERAESSWLRATSMPDGCEHVLPSLNLTLLYIDQMNLTGAKRTLDSFESCIAQYPLRNGEEHRALVSLARGRIALHAGNVSLALEKFKDAFENRQWFGKIGTNAEDLEAALHASLGQAYLAQAHVLGTSLDSSWQGTVGRINVKALSYIFSRWHFARARQVVTEKLLDFEDIHIRNTDSLLEYPTLGQVLTGFRPRVLARRIQGEKKKDPRGIAAIYYRAYLAENALANGSTEEALREISLLLESARPKFDSLLRIHLLSLRASTSPGTPQSMKDIEDIYLLQHAAPRLRGLSLPVRVEGASTEVIALLESAGFAPHDGSERLYTVQYSKSNGEHVVAFVPPDSVGGRMRLQGTDIREVIRRLSDSVFSEDP